MNSYVLIIGKDVARLLEIIAALDQRGFLTELATSESEGILAAITSCPDVVIIETGAGSGSIDGCQVAKALRALPETQDIVILALGDPIAQTSLSKIPCDFDRALERNTGPVSVIEAVMAAIAGRLPRDAVPPSPVDAAIQAPGLPIPAIKKPRKLFLNPSQTPPAESLNAAMPNKHTKLFAKWPTTRWVAVPASMAAAMIAGGAEVVSADEMLARTLRKDGDPGGA